MTAFLLKVVTMDGILFEGDAQLLIVRTTTGELAVLPRHINCVAALGAGQTIIVDAAGHRHHAVCSGGILSVQKECVILLPTIFRWEVKKSPSAPNTKTL